MVACGLAVGLFFLAGIGAGALGHAGFRSLQEGGVEVLRGRFEAWRQNQGWRGKWRRSGGVRGGRNRYQPLRHPQHNSGWRVVSTHSPTPLTGGATGHEHPLPDNVQTFGDGISPTSSEDGGWLQL